MLQPGVLLNDRYEIIEKIGSGGMSHVYKAKCHKLNRFVAIKVLKDEFRVDDEFVSKFKIEAQSAASLSHQNIVNIYDVGNDKNIYYIVMECVEGITLKEYISQKGQLSPEETIHLTIQIASGIEHAHKNHIIHRDIKPQNIIISNNGVAKVTDFGIARAASSATISATNVVGSVHYISPEQARGGYIDEKSDLYSLGITMYEMVTGKVPFEGDSNISVALLHIQEKIKSPSLIRSDIPPSLEAIILKATQKKPTLRYVTMTELIKDLKIARQTPDDDFVKIKDPMDSETVLISEEDVKKIRSVSYDPEDESKADKPKTQNNNPMVEKIIIGSGVLLALAIVATITIFAVSYFKDRYIPNEVPVPLIAGLSVEEANDLLDEYNLFMNIQRYEYSEEFEEGVIMQQAPEDGTIVTEETKINVIVSQGVQLFSVPSVVNQKFNDAERIIITENLTPNRILEYNDTVPMGVVIRQDPNPGTELRRNETVEIYVSNGKEPQLSIVPDLKGLTEDQARVRLNDNNLRLGTVTPVENREFPVGQIISQTVQAGTEVQEDYIIDVAISLGYTRFYDEVWVLNNMLDEDITEAHIRIDFEQEGTIQTVFDQLVTQEEFPIQIPVTGKEGRGTLQLYINDEKQGNPWTINFPREE